MSENHLPENRLWQPTNKATSLAAIRQHRRASAAEILAALRAAVTEFTGDAPLDDDRTALIVKRV